MEPASELVDAIYIEKVMRARRTPIGEKLLDGPRLFAFGCEAMRMGIRMQNPDASPEEVERLLHQRFEIGRRVQEFVEQQNG